MAALAVGVLLVAGPPMLALVEATDDIGATHTRSAPAQPVVRKGPEQGQDQGQDQGHDQDQGRRTHHPDGPPPWASHPRGPQAQAGSWHDLTPKQRARKMARLAQRHATAMRKWAACMQAGGTDCVRPLPPGLAKRLR